MGKIGLSGGVVVGMIVDEGLTLTSSSGSTSTILIILFVITTKIFLTGSAGADLLFVPILFLPFVNFFSFIDCRSISFVSTPLGVVFVHSSLFVLLDSPP